MANKTFLRSLALYEASDKRLQNDIEITGAAVTHGNGRPSSITFGGGGGGGAITLTSPDGSVWTLAISNEGVLSQSKP